MSDLHTHPAVVHLMTTEYWPTINNGTWRLNAPNEKGLGWCWLPHPLGDKNPDWYDETENESVAHSLITLAAVRGLWAKGYMVRQWEFPGGINTKACACYDYDHSHFFGPYGTIWLQPTEPLAILAAYQATVMEQGAPDAKPE